MIKDVIAILEDIKAKDFKLDWSTIQGEKVSITFTHKKDFVEFLRQYHFSYSDCHISEICINKFKVTFKRD